MEAMCFQMLAQSPVITLKTGHVQVCMDIPAALTGDSPFMAEVLAYFDDGSDVYPQPFYYSGAGEQWCANINLPDASYMVTMEVDSVALFAQPEPWLFAYGFDRDFVRADPASLQRMIKGSASFFPAGFNAQYGTNKIHVDTADLAAHAHPDSAGFTAKSHAALMYQMQEAGYYNYIRFNFSDSLNPMAYIDTFGVFDTAAFNRIDKIWDQVDYYDMHAWTTFWHRGGNWQLPMAWYFTDPDKTAQFNAAWAASKFNNDNGGPLDHPFDAIFDSTMQRYYRAYIREVIARWGWRTNWFMRELCAEVYLWDHNVDTLPALVDAWQESLFDYAKTIDPNGQFISSGDGATITVRQDASWADAHVTHLHPNPPNKWKVTSISADSTNLYAIYHHFDHHHTDHVDLAEKTFTCGALGYGQKVETNYPDKSSPEYLSTRTKWDRHAYWESLFSGSCGVGAAWDTKGALADYGAPDFYVPVFRFAWANQVPREDFEMLNDLFTKPLNDVYAMGLKNENRTLVYLFDVQNDTVFLDSAANCPVLSGVKVQVPVDFTGTAQLELYDTDDCTAPVATSTENIISGQVTVLLPPFRRAVAIAVTPGGSAKAGSTRPVSPLELWPNPAGSTLHVRAASAGTLALYDAQGKLHRMQRVNGQASLAVDDLPRGFYTVVWMSGTDRQTRKLLLQ